MDEIWLRDRLYFSTPSGVAAVFSQLPIDYYHDLHLPHDPPLYPVFEHPPPTKFSCVGRSRGVVSQLPIDYYHDLHLPHDPPPTAFSCTGRGRGYYAYHFCWRHRLVSTDLCVNGTLFNEQFQVCDHFYNVRCGSPYEDL
ncbi:hypothetical protein ABMA28_011167 [Loxostege sticticalis]|uniref:Chitin-binding type-2 domain-containing protein n=1 Tax=Loxostege sticticalis TaxID=481309 RepID=A0ABD0S6Y9_LOXSC